LKSIENREKIEKLMTQGSIEGRNILVSDFYKIDSGSDFRERYYG